MQHVAGSSALRLGEPGTVRRVEGRHRGVVAASPRVAGDDAVSYAAALGIEWRAPHAVDAFLGLSH